MFNNQGEYKYVFDQTNNEMRYLPSCNHSIGYEQRIVGRDERSLRFDTQIMDHMYHVMTPRLHEL